MEKSEMKIVVSLEKAVELKEYGFPQESALGYVKEDDEEFYLEKDYMTSNPLIDWEDDKDGIAAPTFREIIKYLPKKIIYNNASYFFTYDPTSPTHTFKYSYSEGLLELGGAISFDNDIEDLADFWIHIKSKGYIK